MKKARRTMKRTMAAIDLGSNSFHLILAVLKAGRLEIVDRVKETVRLRSGLSEEGELSPAARSRALSCLARFGERLRAAEVTHVRAVGTDALRRAGDRRDFLEAAETALGHPVDIISGYEEARLIYAGATPDAHVYPGQRLVLDIGGGSTELVLGRGARPKILNSLGVGSVSLTERCFKPEQVRPEELERAISIARGELSGVAAAYREAGWTTALGASGTIRSIAAIAQARGLGDGDISHQALQDLSAELLRRRQLRASDFPEVKADRIPILPGGLAVLRAVFEVMGLERMQVAPGALREGLLEDMAGRIARRDIRHRTVTEVMRRYRLDRAHGRAVARTAVSAWKALAPNWQLDEVPESRAYLQWAASLHEVGMAISHSQHQRHGAYILAHADMAGFSRNEQTMLATLVQLQRKKLSRHPLEVLAPRYRPIALSLACLLRVAIVLHRTRESALPVRFQAGAPGRWALRFAPGSLGRHPLLLDDLQAEVDYQEAAGIRLELL